MNPIHKDLFSCSVDSRESGHFGLATPDVRELETMAEEFESEEKVWSLFEEFEKDINGLADEEWVVMRSVWSSKANPWQHLSMIQFRLCSRTLSPSLSLPTFRCIYFLLSFNCQRCVSRALSNAPFIYVGGASIALRISSVIGVVA